CARGSEDFDFW
nr:immunoglobulin heavy chain junction region [Macaca mulatta]MOY24126.1 immunoglobulin heavy chain junction region [Macaca mulatta]